MRRAEMGRTSGVARRDNTVKRWKRSMKDREGEYVMRERKGE